MHVGPAQKSGQCTVQGTGKADLHEVFSDGKDPAAQTGKRWGTKRVTLLQIQTCGGMGQSHKLFKEKIPTEMGKWLFKAEYFINVCGKTFIFFYGK